MRTRSCLSHFDGTKTNHYWSRWLPSWAGSRLIPMVLQILLETRVPQMGNWSNYLCVLNLLFIFRKEFEVQDVVVHLPLFLHPVSTVSHLTPLGYSWLPKRPPCPPPPSHIYVLYSVLVSSSPPPPVLSSQTCLTTYTHTVPTHDVVSPLYILLFHLSLELKR